MGRANCETLGPLVRRPWRVLVPSAFGVALLWSVAAISLAAPGSTCATCVPPARSLQASPPPSLLGTEVRRILPGGPVKPRLKNGRLVARPTSRAVVKAIVARFSAAEPVLLASLQSALATHGTAVHPPGTRSLAGLSSTAPTVNVNPNGSASAGLGFGGTVSGSRVHGSLDLTVDTAGRLGAGLDVTTTDRSGGTKSWGFTYKGGSNGQFGTGRDCPDSTGTLDLSSDDEVTTRTGETFGPKWVSLGAVKEAIRVRVRSSAQVHFGADGRALPFTVTVSASVAYKRTGRALFLHSKSRMSASRSMTGTLDPATGATSGGTTTSSAHTSGFDGTQAAADAEAAALVKKMVDEEVARILKKVRDAELKCGHYDVTLSLTTYANFATHTSQGGVNAILTAVPDVLAIGPPRFTGMLPVLYENLIFTSLIPPCTMISPVSSVATLQVEIQPLSTTAAQVSWHADPSLVATATVSCPSTEGPVDIPGQPGPALVAPDPMSFQVPLEGGTVAIAGGLTASGGGWVHAGTMTVTRRFP